MSLSDLDPAIRAQYEPLIRELPDGRIIAAHRLLMHWTLLVGIDDVGYTERYCFATFDLVLAAFNDWDGTGEPTGWHRHPTTGRRRDLETGREWVAP